MNPACLLPAISQYGSSTHAATWKEARNEMSIWMHMTFNMVSMTSQCSGWKLANSAFKSTPLGVRDRDGMGSMAGNVLRDRVLAGSRNRMEVSLLI